jgi:hypothetical protein
VLVTGASRTLAPFVIHALWQRHEVVLLSRRPPYAEYAARRVTGGHRGEGCTLGMHTPHEECTTQRGRLKHSAQDCLTECHYCSETSSLQKTQRVFMVGMVCPCHFNSTRA